MKGFDIAVVVSNDSDLVAPIKIVRIQLGKKVGVLNPQKNPSRAIWWSTLISSSISAPGV